MMELETYNLENFNVNFDEHETCIVALSNSDIKLRYYELKSFIKGTISIVNKYYILIKGEYVSFDYHTYKKDATPELEDKYTEDSFEIVECGIFEKKYRKMLKSGWVEQKTPKYTEIRASKFIIHGILPSNEYK